MPAALLDPASLQIVPIDEGHNFELFTCGDDDLDGFARDDAKRLHDANVTRVYVALYEGNLAGYVAILADTIELRSDERKKHGQQHTDPRFVPAVKVGRLAVATEMRSRCSGLGTMLMQFAALTALAWSQDIGCRFLTVDAYQASVGFYEKLGFIRNKAIEARAARSSDAPVSSRSTISMRFDLHAKTLPTWIIG